MSFSFGAAKPAAGPAPSAAPAFSFGGAAPAPATGAAPAASAPAFSFGGAAPAPAASAPASTAPAPAFSFGGAAPTPAAPAPATTAAFAAPTPSTGLSFGGAASTPAAPAPAPAATSVFGGGISTASTSTAITTATTLTAPDFDDTFENLDVWNRTRKLCAETSNQQTQTAAGTMSLAGQELMHFLSTNATTALKPKVVEWTPPNNGLRQQLAQKPMVGLSGGTSTTLTNKTLEQIGLLATELRISEAQAITLYAQISRDYDVLNGLLTSSTADGGGGGFIDRALPGAKYDNVTKLARDFYFYERRLKLQTILYLVELRLHNNPDVIRATDTLLQEGQLVTNLVTVIREYTQRIEQLQQVIKSNVPSAAQNSTGAMGGTMSFMGGSQQQPQQHQQQNTTNFAKVHLLFCTEERQTAAEALVFIAYHTQLEVNEITALIDLIRDLSTGLPKLSPFKDVPNPYDSSSDGMDGMNGSYQQSGGVNTWPPMGGNFSYNQYPWKRKDKNSLEWQKELIRETCKTGRPKLLQCTSLLIVAAMAAMDSRQVLYDRKLHGPNNFGMGNQLLHPTQPSLENIKELHTRLKPEAHKQWARPDIWGLLACSYALLLRLTPLAITSPTKGGSNSSFSREVREAARYCIEVPTELMSFTFCRLTLIPSLEKIQSASVRTICNVSEFCLSVLSEVYSLYLSILSEGNGNLPISRKMWQDREEEDLKLKIQQYHDKLQFEAFLGQSSKKEEVPKAIDLMERQECLDDIIALATSLCSLGPNYARHFWAKDNESKALVPSRALRECIALAAEDDSLIPYVYSWMAALSNDEKSAKAVNRLMSSNKSNDNSVEGAAASFTSWRTVIHNLRFYVQHLSVNNDINVSKPSSPRTKASASNNTSYYYNLEGDAMRDSSRDSRSRDGGGRTKSSSASSSKNSMKPKELSEGSKLRVASYLALIMNVSLHCFDARHSILSTSLPLVDGDIAAGGDECLVILFKLAIAPLSPQMRGATLSTIASLLRSTDGIEDPKTKAFMEEQGNNAWEYLESCSLLPIHLLDRYRVIKPTGADVQNQGALAFPPSSMTLAGLASRIKSSFPKHPMYGVLYEMDHIESKKGWYPSTEGFLDLLNSLVSSVGCPSKLGQNWRLRTGCTPYLEYVINFVLPKALGVNSQPELPFRVPGDRSRLVSRALAVVESVVIRYNLPTQTSLKNTKEQVSTPTSTPLSVLGIQTVVDQVHVISKQQELQEIKNDFRSMTVSSTLHAPNQQYGLNNSTLTPVSDQAVLGSSSVSIVPVPKSPGFTILVELLSSSCGVLLQVLNAVLTECGGRNGILPIFRDQSIDMDMTFALFGSTPPDLNSAKEGVKEDGPSKPLQNLLKTFFPKFQTSNIDDHFVDNSVLWRETSIASALHILCAAATREETFIATLTAAKEQPLKFVPVIEFQELKPGSGSALAIDKKAKDVRVSPLSDLLFSITGSRHLRANIIDYIGYHSVAKDHSTEISAAALSVVYRMQQRISPEMSLRSLCGNEYTTSGFSKSIADRLRLSSRNLDRIRDSEVLTLILNWILTELRSCTIANDGLAQVLLGLPGDTSNGNWKPGRGHYSGAINDCFDAILDILGHNELSSGFSGISSLCFEVVFRLHDLLKAKDEKSLKVAIYTAERLRGVDFWAENVSRIPYVDVSVMDQEQYVQHLHSTAWLLKGLACELRLLVGFGGDTIAASQFGRYLEQHPNTCNFLLSKLYGSDKGVIYDLVKSLPLELVSMDPSLPHPSQEALIAGVIDLPGAKDVVEGYQILDAKKVLFFMGASQQKQQSLENNESVKQWIDQWNFNAGRNCAVSHLTSSMSVLIDASLFSVESMSRCHTSLSQSSNFSHSWLHNNGSRDLLAFFLQRLADIPSVSDSQGMDASLIPVATKNLSTIVLTLSEFITLPSHGDLMNSSDVLQLAAFVARTIPSSSIGNDSADEAPYRHERTAALGSALSQLLRSSASLEPEFVSQYREEFIRAAQELSNISGFKVDSSNNDSRGIVSMLARGCVSSIVLALSHVKSECTSTAENSCVCSCIPQEFLVQSMSLVAELDEDICNFLQVIALQPSGAKMLMDAGIGDALLCAARLYMEQEKTMIQSLEGSSSSFTKTTVRTPGFLLGHLKLICALLVVANKIPEDMAYRFASSCIEIIGAYEGTIHRLCFNFPVQADFLRWFLKALVAASSVVKPLKRKIQIHKVEHEYSAKELISRAKFLDNGIVMLLEQLLENPLPRDMLPSRMPRELKHTTANASAPTGMSSNVVNVEKDDSATWWDVLQNILSSRQGYAQSCNFPAPASDKLFLSSSSLQKWSEDTFEYSIVAADTLNLGLQLLKRVERSDLFRGTSLASGLFRCAVAAKSVDDRLESLRFRTMTVQNGNSMDDGYSTFKNLELELEYVKMLAGSLAQCVEQLLMLCLQVCDADSEIKENSRKAVLKPILVAVESSGVDTFSLTSLSQERSEFIGILCQEIKKLCKV